MRRLSRDKGSQKLKLLLEERGNRNRVELYSRKGNIRP